MQQRWKPIQLAIKAAFPYDYLGEVKIYTYIIIHGTPRKECAQSYINPFTDLSNYTAKDSSHKQPTSYKISDITEFLEFSSIHGF